MSKEVYDTQIANRTNNGQPQREKDSRLIRLCGGVNVRDDRTVFLQKYVIDTRNGQRSGFKDFPKSTWDKILAILEADATAMGGTLLMHPIVPILHQRIDRPGAPPVQTSSFIRRCIDVAKAAGMKIQGEDNDGYTTVASSGQGENAGMDGDDSPI